MVRQNLGSQAVSGNNEHCAKVLVIAGGVAGLAAVGQAINIVRAFDV